MIVNGYEINPGANLHGANLYGANLYGADLSGANLSGADLRHADLYGANLYGADLYGADLRGADLQGANFRRARLQGSNLPDFQIPQDVGITVYKKLADDKVAKLFIPENAKRTANLASKKCRAEFALVVSIDGDDTPGVRCNALRGYKGWPEFTYTVGEVVHPDKYDDDIRLECTNGIHFFMTCEEAENWF